MNSIRTAPEAQEPTVWAPPTGTLGRLVAEAGERAAMLSPRRAELERAARDASDDRSMVAALAGGDRVALIAEVKQRSPSRGDIAPSVDAPSRATAYER